MKEELENWKNATIIRILASTATTHNQDNIAELLKKEKQELSKQEKQGHKGRQRFLLCDKDKTRDYFGDYFTNLIDARKSDKKLAEVVKTQAGVKRGLAEVVSEQEDSEADVPEVVEGKRRRFDQNPVRDEEGARRSRFGAGLEWLKKRQRKGKGRH